MEQNRTRQKVSRYPRSLNLNLGMIIFSVILIYVLICVVAYFRSRKITGYEVKEGSLSNNHIYNDAIALREESVVPVTTAGYINYFVSEGTRVGVGNLVYTIDEAGGMQDLLLSEGTDTIKLSADDQRELRAQIVQFGASFDPSQFQSVYHFQNTLQGTAQKLTNAQLLENMRALNDIRVQSIGYYNAEQTGTVVFQTDGMEGISPEALTARSFDREQYERTTLTNNALVQEGDTAYKVVTDENWKVVFPTDEETAAQLLEEEYIKVRFLKNQYESWGKVETTVGADNTPLVVLSFSNSMETFCADRFLSIEILLQEMRGLKVPLSAIVEKNFFLVDESYVTMGTEGVQGVMKRTYTENGQSDVVFTEIQAYEHIDKKYYVDTERFSAGDVLYKPDSQETMTVEEQGTLTGVYNMNRGFADFRQIEILSSNDEYALVKPDSQYGLSVYDHIVLDASTVSDDELLYD